MGLGKTYSTKYLLDSNNSSGVAGQVLSTTSTGIDWVNANTIPGTGLWLANGNDIYNSNSDNVGIGLTDPGAKLEVTTDGTKTVTISNTRSTTATSLSEIRAFYTLGMPALRSSGTNGLFVSNVTGNIAGIQSVDTSDNAISIALQPFGGNIGIGTLTADSKLDVTGGSITVNTNGTGFMDFKYGTVGSESAMGSIRTDGIDLKINATSDLLLLPGSNVGVGTTTPDYKFEVQGVISSADSALQKATFANVGADLVLAANADATNVTANILFKSSGSGGAAVSEKMRIDSVGNVGIGTDDPETKLHVEGTSGSIYIQSTTANQNASVYFNSKVGTTQLLKWEIGTNIGNGADFEIFDREKSQTRFLIETATGNVGIGTTGPNYKLDVQANTAGDYAALINNSNSTNGYGLLVRTAHTGASACLLYTSPSPRD